MSTKVILIRNAAATDFGGGERVPVFIAKELKKYNIDPIVFSGSIKLLDFAQSEGVAHKKTWWWPLQNWSGARALLFPAYVVWQLILFFYYIGLFSGYRPKTVHIQSKDDFIAATFAARVLGIAVFWSDYADLKHIWMNHRVWYKNPVGKFVYLAAYGATTIVAVSKEDRRLIAENIPDGTIKNKLEVIYNGTFDSYSLSPKAEQFTYISTSRLVVDKGIRELILAFQQLVAIYPDIQLDLIGDGPDKDMFIDLAKDTLNIHFLGHQSQPLTYVARSHVFVLPTYHEGFSIALVEACMEQTAIIATNIGGNPEIIVNETNGLLIAVKSVDQLFTAMRRLYEDQPLAQKLATAARERYVTDFNFSTIIKNQFLPLYNK